MPFQTKNNSSLHCNPNEVLQQSKFKRKRVSVRKLKVKRANQAGVYKETVRMETQRNTKKRWTSKS